MNPQEEFLIAIEESDITNIKKLLKNDFVDPSYGYNSSLMEASRNGNLEIIKLLVEEGNIDPSYSESFLIQDAAMKNNIEIIKYLLNYSRVNPSARNNLALKRAVKFDNFEIFKLLLNNLPTDIEHSGLNIVLEEICSFNRFQMFKLIESDNRFLNEEILNNELLSIALANDSLEIAYNLFKYNYIFPVFNDFTNIVCSPRKKDIFPVLALCLEHESIDPSDSDNWAIQTAVIKENTQLVIFLLKDPRVRNTLNCIKDERILGIINKLNIKSKIESF